MFQEQNPYYQDGQTNIEPEGGSMTMLDKTPVLVLKGIKLTEATTKLLYGTEVATAPQIDLVHLASEDIARDPDDTKDIDLEIKQEKGLAHFLWLTLKKKFRDDKELDRQRNIVKTRRKYVRESGDSSTFTSTITQRRDMHIMLDKMFGNLLNPSMYTEYMLEEFRNILKKDPSKRLLIIEGHGSSDPSSSWTLGEKYQEGVPVENLLAHLQAKHSIDFSQYAAVVFYACNEAHKRPPQIAGVPVVYTDGVVGQSTERKPIISYPIEHFTS